MNKKYILHKDDKRAEAIRNNAINFIRMINLERSTEIIIQPHRKSHSDDQRGALHFLCQEFGDRLGYTLGETKEMVKKYVYGTRHVRIGDKVYEVTESSEVNEEGEPRDVIDYGRLIDGVYLLAAEAGEVLPILDKNYYIKRKSA